MSGLELVSKGPGLAELRKALQAVRVGQAYVVAGVTGKGGDESRGTLTNSQLALVHEFGCPERGIPARPFILPSAAKHRTEYQRMLQVVVRKAITVGFAEGLAGADTYLQGLKFIGLKMASDMKAFVTADAPIPPPNAPATLARKIAKGKWKGKPGPALDEFGRLADPSAAGQPRTLVDTGRMVGSITWELRGTEDKP